VEEQTEEVPVKLKTIAAVSLDGIIGVDGDIPWKCSEDLRRFKRLTLGSTIVMGRKTWESIGSKRLPGRKNIVISSRASDELAGSPTVFPSIKSFLDAHLSSDSPSDVWFIGGEGIYNEAVPMSDEVYVTRVETNVGIKDGAAKWNFEKTFFDKEFIKELGPMAALATYNKTPVPARFIKYTRLGTI
tara:strand:- start:468 stop:1028 length:561 start_codon:yes stop_codon:yes gene_type:complete